MTENSAVGESLDRQVLARRERLPVKPAPVTLTGRLVVLRPLDLERDIEPLHAISDGTPAMLGERSTAAYDAEALIWRYLPGGPFATAAGLGDYLRRQAEAPNGRCLCVTDAGSGRPIGITNYMNNSPADLKVELGGIWYGRVAQATGANLEATLLMLRHAFSLGYRRLEWKCDALNLRSRRAALRMGFLYEGQQQYHFIVKGRNRDTDWFRILDREWPAVEEHLAGMLRSG